MQEFKLWTRVIHTHYTLNCLCIMNLTSVKTRGTSNLWGRVRSWGWGNNANNESVFVLVLNLIAPLCVVKWEGQVLHAASDPPPPLPTTIHYF